MMILSETIGSAIGKVAETIGDLFTSDKERLEAHNVLAALQSSLVKGALDYEAQIVAAQASIIQAEANGKSWLQRNWRPITMLTFVSLIVARWMGWTMPGMTEAEYLAVYELMKLGIGGYVMGRSAEKIAPGVIRAWRDTRQNPERPAP